MARELVNGFFAKKADKDFVVTKVSLKTNDFLEFINSKKGIIEENNGWLNFEILKSKNDRNKWYASYNDWKPEKQVSTSDHSPDREADLPF
jgi:hypothetical protein